jgi:hypothetical protein
MALQINEWWVHGDTWKLFNSMAYNLKEVIVVDNHWKCRLWHVGIYIGPIGFSFMPNAYNMSCE